MGVFHVARPKSVFGCLPGELFGRTGIMPQVVNDACALRRRYRRNVGLRVIPSVVREVSKTIFCDVELCPAFSRGQSHCLHGLSMRPISVGIRFWRNHV